MKLWSRIATNLTKESCLLFSYVINIGVKKAVTTSRQGNASRMLGNNAKLQTKNCRKWKTKCDRGLISIGGSKIDHIRILSIGLELACNGGSCGGNISNYLHLKSFPRMSLHRKLVPVQYREHEYGLLLLSSFHATKACMTQHAMQEKLLL